MDTFDSIVAIEYLSSDDLLLGGGTGFFCSAYLITNNHVYSATNFRRVRVRCGGIEVTLSRHDFHSLLVSGSDENNQDFAILEKPKEFAHAPDLIAKRPTDIRVSDPVMYFGYPFGFQHPCFHKGYISSIYCSKNVDKFRIDGSVNHGNSGGPLIDPKDGSVIGLITRKETGLTEALIELEKAASHNADLFKKVSEQGGMRVFGISITDSLSALQLQIIQALFEIKRSANVGIGIAFSSKYIVDEIENLSS